MDKLTRTSYTPLARAQLRPASEPASNFDRLSTTKVESPSAFGQSTQTTTSVFKQATSLLQEPNFQKKSSFSNFYSKSKAEYSLTKADNKKSLEKVEGIRIHSLDVPNPHINKLDQDLQANLKLATRIAGEVSQAIPKSANALQSGRVYYRGPPNTTKTGSARREVIVPHSSVVGALGKQRLSMKQGFKTWDHFFQWAETTCKKSGIGNCMELAAIACKSLKDNGAKHVDYVVVTDNKTGNSVLPHMFAVVGRTDSGNTPKMSIKDVWEGQLSKAGGLGAVDKLIDPQSC